MSAFSASNSGASTTNYTNDTTFYFVGQGQFVGPPDWTTVLDNYVSGELGPFTSSWFVANTGGNGKILSVTFQVGDFGNKSVVVVLQSGGGTFNSGGANMFTPPQVACFVKGTRILTQGGYKTIETLTRDDRVVTSDSRTVPFKLIRTIIPKAAVTTAPYLIEAGAFGANMPPAPLRLSANHHILVRKGVWMTPVCAARTNPRVRQYGVGEPVTYYHIECADYLRDNIIAEGAIVESFCSKKAMEGLDRVYTWSSRINGFTRINAGTIYAQKYA